MSQVQEDRTKLTCVSFSFCNFEGSVVDISYHQCIPGETETHRVTCSRQGGK